MQEHGKRRIGTTANKDLPCFWSLISMEKRLNVGLRKPLAESCGYAEKMFSSSRVLVKFVGQSGTAKKLQDGGIPTWFVAL